MHKLTLPTSKYAFSCTYLSTYLFTYKIKYVCQFAIGDKTGVLQYLSIKDEEPIVHFKTLPGKPITSVQVPYGTPADKIFAASGNEVKGYTRKGKVFLAIETSLSETITSMFILGDDLILCAGRTVTHYRDLREYHSYLCEDRILDVAAFAIPNSKRVRLLVLIANKGAILLENGSVVTRLTITSGSSRLILPPNINSAGLCSFYGAADGSIGIITYEETMLQSKCLIEGRGLGSVVCMGWYFKDGVHLAVGRHDGSIQLYFIDPENFGEKPRLKYTYFSGEPVTSVCGGCVGTEESEVLAATFSGRVFALRGRKFVSGAGSFVGVPSDALTSRRTKLETEVARLEKQAAVEREKYQRNTRSDHARISAPPLLDLQYESSGATREGWQEIRIASAVPLDMLFVYCNRKLDLQTDSAAVLSVCPSQGPLDDLLATVRCQAGTRRLWVRMRYSNVVTTVQKAESTRVLIYALPAGAPRVARLMTLRLPVLPYYSQHEDPETNFEDRILCQLLVSGSFSVAEMTSWLAEAFPDEMPRPASNVEFVRRHTLLGTLLICQYQRGSASFKSDNVSSIATIKDVILNCTMKKGIRVEISCDIPNGCCANSFKNIQPLFEKEYKKNQNIKLKQALSALDLNTNMSIDEQIVLCNDYQQVWESSDDTISDSNFSELVETIETWYIDWHALTIHGCENNNERRRLLEALNNNQVDEILIIFSKESLHN